MRKENRANAVMEAKIKQSQKHRCFAASRRKKNSIRAFVFKAISYFKMVSSIHMYFTIVSLISILIVNIKKMSKENVHEHKNKSFVLFQQVTKPSYKKLTYVVLFVLAFVYSWLVVRTNENSIAKDSRVKILMPSQCSFEHEMLPCVFETGYFEYGRVKIIVPSQYNFEQEMFPRIFETGYDNIFCSEKCGFFNTSVLNFIEMGTSNYDVSLFDKYGNIVNYRI